MWAVWLAFWGELNTPSSYRADPYGALTNAASHILLGMFFVVLISLLYCLAAGEMPVRFYVWAVVTLGYLFVVERLLQEWNGPDSIVDAGFVGLGAAAPLVALKEVSFQPMVALEPKPLQGLVALAAIVVALAVYVLPRAVRKWRENQGIRP